MRYIDKDLLQTSIHKHAKARGLSLCTGAQTMFYLSLRGKRDNSGTGSYMETGPRFNFSSEKPEKQGSVLRSLDW